MIINQRFGGRRKRAQAVVSSLIRLKMKNKIKSQLCMYMFLPLLCTEECVCVVVYTLYNFRRICRIESTLTGGRFTAHLEEKFQRLIRSLKITTTPS